MNKWVKKSIELANGRGYLDNLSTIYPVELNTSRELSNQEKEGIRSIFEKGDRKELVLFLLSFNRFPIDDPYIGFLRRDVSAIDRNPRTIKRISDQLFKIGVEGIVSGIQRPKSSSRQFGQYFKNCLPTLGHPVLEAEDFLKIKGTAFLKGGDKSLKIFAKKYLGYKGKKGLDLVFKKNNNFFIGEAKFISASGGTQDKSFRETMDFLRKKSSKAKHIAILDGVVWAAHKNSNTAQLYGSVKRLSEGKVVISALLLKDFIEGRE